MYFLIVFGLWDPPTPLSVGGGGGVEYGHEIFLELHNANYCEPIRLQPCFCSPMMAESIGSSLFCIVKLKRTLAHKAQKPMSTKRPSLLHNQTVIITCFRIRSVILFTSSFP